MVAGHALASESRGPQLAELGAHRELGAAAGHALSNPVARPAGGTDPVLLPVGKEERYVLNSAFAPTRPLQGASLVAIF